MNSNSPDTGRRGLVSSGGVCPEARDFGFLNKLNTLSRARRRKQEADDLAEEARQAMEDPLHPAPFELSLDGFQLAEGEERSMIEPQSKVSVIHPLEYMIWFVFFIKFVMPVSYVPLE
ncbi:Alpha-parvin [Fasciola hepatica]|uniref:Alpha-parvin n=1 Tax=Fasciola hepatica TaxID=6192 RepID=A0A2H1BRI9_FASHE|nr:Alpha-parvin [Fasciola hepatica]